MGVEASTDQRMPVLKRPRTGAAIPAPRQAPKASTDLSPTALIEAQLSPEGEPVLGLYLHVAYHRVMASFGRKVGHGEVSPAIIGVVSTLAAYPGISQAKLARRMGHERATVGTTVARAIEAGLVERQDAHGDARSYALCLSPAGERMLRTLRRRIADHEAATGGHLTADERRNLRALLHKLVYG
jgi:DNA-binding MarR family transcriptional regulator